MLRALEAAGLVLVGPGDPDRRVRTARLTAAGLAERAVLDRRSDELAGTLLEPLSPVQQTRLVAAMVRVVEVDPADERARSCLRAYLAELDRRFEAGYDSARSIAATDGELRAPHDLAVVATLHGGLIGFGALKHRDGAAPEIKRMWVAESARGLGVGRRLLEELEARAAARGATAVRLETNRSLVEAISLYRSAGYVEVAPFNAEPYAHHWFEKRLGVTAPPAPGAPPRAATAAPPRHC